VTKRICSKCSKTTSQYHCENCGGETEPINLRKREMARRILRHARWYLFLYRNDNAQKEATAILFNREGEV
jgi:hypothetical protein